MLMDTKGLADMLGLSVRHVRERLVTSPNFPRPAVQLSVKMRRWDSTDINAWITKQRKRCAR